MYKLIVLIISSDDPNGFYSDMKRISAQYLQMTPPGSVKYFYVQLTDDLNDDIVEHGDHIFIKGTESLIPGIYYKTVKAIEYINKHYEYKMIMRTNMSSFLHMDNILKYVDKQPDTNFAGGFWYDDGKFITGTGIFLSRDVGNLLVDSEKGESQMTTNTEDDVLISRILLQHNVPIYDIAKQNEFHWIHLVHNVFDPNHRVPDNLLYYRIKNIDRNLDIMWFRYLMQKIYKRYVY